MKPGHYSSYIKPHLQKVEASVKSKERELPEHCPELDANDKKILLAEQHASIRNVSQPPRLLLCTWIRIVLRMEDANKTNAMIFLCLLPCCT